MSSNLKHNLKLISLTILVILISFFIIGILYSNQISEITKSISPHNQLAQVPSLDNGLVAHYTFDDGTATDSSGNNNNGTLQNGPTPVAGNVGSGAMGFDGIDDRISTPAQLPASGAFTVSMWIKRDFSTVSHILFCQDHDGTHDLCVFHSNTFNGFAYENENNTTDTMTGWTYALDNNWHHITLVEPYTGDVDGAFFYVDGVLITSTFGGQNISPAQSNFHIGSRIGSDLMWQGGIDDVHIYNRALSASEVTELYNYTSTSVTPSPVNGLCGTVVNICTAGISVDIADSATDYRWNCAGTNGGSTASCSLTIPTTPDEVDISGGNLYISQTTQGNASASSCANSQSMVWLNNATNWGNGAYQIGPGDTVHLCGTISSQLTVRGSGTSGNPVTVVFEPNAKMSAPTWPVPAAIYIPSRSNVIIDGGSNGVVEATASGTNFPFAPVTQRAVRSEGGTNVEIKNLIIRNFYLRTPLSNDPADQGFGMSLAGTSNLSVHHNTISEMRTGIVASGIASNISIYSNRLTRISNGMFISAGGSASSVINGLEIYDNTILDGYVWDGILSNGHWFHNDGIQISAPTPGSYTDNVEVYGNVIGGDMGTHITALIYMEDDIRNTKVYNNILYTTGTSWPVNGFIVSGTPSWVYGNTIVASAGGTGIHARGPQSKVIGNLMIGISYGISTVDDSRLGVSDYNLYYFWKDREMGSRPYIYKYDKWKAELGYDQHSVEITSPQLASVFIDKVNSDFRLKAGSPAIDAIQSADTATLLRGISLVNASGDPVDFIGTPRPQGSAWDIGAYEYCEGGNCSSQTYIPPSPPSTPYTPPTLFTPPPVQPTPIIQPPVIPPLTPTPTPVVVQPLTQDLTPEQTNNDIATLNTFLYNEGYLSTLSPTPNTYTSETIQAVQAFQRANNIVNSGTPDTTGYGTVGPKTKEVINSILNNKYNNTLSTPQPFIPLPTSTTEQIDTNTTTISWFTILKEVIHSIYINIIRGAERTWEQVGGGR